MPRYFAAPDRSKTGSSLKNSSFISFIERETIFNGPKFCQHDLNPFENAFPFYTVMHSLTDPAETPAGGEIQQACGLPTDTAAFVRPSLRAREVYGLRHTSEPYGEGGLYTLHTYKRDHNRISVGIAVVEQGPNEGDPMIELHLEVRTDDCPHIRQVIFEHSVGYILTCCDYGGLEEYLKACCPSDYQEALEVIALAFMDRLANGWE